MIAVEVNHERLYTRVRELCALNAPSRHEQPVYTYLHRFWQERKDQGLEFETVAVQDPSDTPNIIMRLKGIGEPLLLCSHMDTVPLPPGPVLLVETDGVLSTDGNSILGSDDRAGIALALEMVDLCLEHTNHPPLELVFTVQEELGCIGSAYLNRALFQSNTAINLDGETPVGTAITSAPQKGRFTIRVNGVSAHAALQPQLGQSAIRLAAEILLKLPHGQLDPFTTANIGTIVGGSQTNVVCDLVTLTGELRSFSSELYVSHRRLIDTLVTEHQMPEECSADLEWEEVYAGFSLPETAAIVVRFKTACVESGYNPHLLRSAGGGDANMLNSIGIPMIVFGMGMHHIHTTREFLIWRELSSAAELLARMVFRTSICEHSDLGSN